MAPWRDDEYDAARAEGESNRRADPRLATQRAADGGIYDLTTGQPVYTGSVDDVVDLLYGRDSRPYGPAAVARDDAATEAFRRWMGFVDGEDDPGQVRRFDEAARRILQEARSLIELYGAGPEEGDVSLEEVTPEALDELRRFTSGPDWAAIPNVLRVAVLRMLAVPDAAIHISVKVAPAGLQTARANATRHDAKEQLRAKARRMHRDGKTIHQIATALDRSDRTITRYLGGDNSSS